MFRHPSRPAFHTAMQIAFVAIRGWLRKLSTGIPVSEMDYLGLI